MTTALIPPEVTERWADFDWPDWVPLKVQKEIEEFWGCFGRSPKDWLKNWIEDYPTVPYFGDVATRGVVADGEEYATGRYVHAWNNIGRIVLPDGSYRVVCGTRRKYVPNWGGAGRYV